MLDIAYKEIKYVFHEKLITLIYEQFGMLPETDRGNDLVTRELYFIFAIYEPISTTQPSMLSSLKLFSSLCSL